MASGASTSPSNNNSLQSDERMPRGGEHLKDEVGRSYVHSSRVLTDQISQGSKSQVIIAGAAAGLIAR